MTEPHTTTDGESWLAQREDHASLLAKVESLVVNAQAYLDARELSDSDIEDLTRTFSYTDVSKEIGNALHAHGFQGFRRRAPKPSPPDPKVVKRLQDYAASYVVNAGTELADRIRADGDTMIHTDTAADYARAYSEIVLCRMVFGLPEMNAATFSRRQSGNAKKKQGKVLPFPTAIAQIAGKVGKNLDNVWGFLENEDAIEDWYSSTSGNALPIHTIEVHWDQKSVSYTTRNGKHQSRKIETVARALRANPK